MFEFTNDLPVPVGQLLRFVIIVSTIGIGIMFVGEAIPRRIYNFTKFPYTSRRFESGGEVYMRIGVHKWKDYLPDLSKYIKKIFRKQIGTRRDPEYIRLLILETCNAEFVHVLLILVSPIFLFYMAPGYGAAGMIVYIVGNLPFIIIQRYNRPRLVVLMNRLKETPRLNKGEEPCK